ncbi:hypothetical protein U6B65_05825 [Oscillospiraceae bacterium MB08-C2-2]|nr:hypothetical protein U6B65_05825 [Oscillospiraceae bacterium MB08-C2-2]
MGTIVFQTILNSVHLSSAAGAIRCWYPGTGWTGWKHLATAEPPQKYDLQYATGFSAYTKSEYWKNQFSECTVIARCQSSVDIISGHVIALLPEGYWPTSIVSVLCRVKYPSETVFGYVDVLPDGQIKIYPDHLVAGAAIDIIINPIRF